MNQRSNQEGSRLSWRDQAPKAIRILVGPLSFMLACAAACLCALATPVEACTPPSTPSPGTQPLGGPCPATGSQNPVLLYEGILTESYLDARVDAPGIAWSHVRKYSSSLESTTEDPLRSIQGSRWEVYGLTTWGYVEISGTTISVYFDAARKTVFTWNATYQKYDPPAATRMTLDYYHSSSATGSCTGATTTSITDTSKSYTADALVGQYVEMTGGTYAGERRVITDNTSDTITWAVELDGAPSSGTTYKLLDRVAVHDEDTQNTYEFAGRNGNWATGEVGQMESWQDEYGNLMTYTYDPNEPGGRINMVMLANLWSTDYQYVPSGVNVGKVSQFDVCDSEGNAVQRVKYTYFDSATHSADVGTQGDLVMVEVLKHASGEALDTVANTDDNDFSIKEVTQYRYCRGTAGSPVNERTGEDWGHAHQLKLVLEKGTVDKLMSDQGLSASDILTKSDRRPRRPRPSR